MKESLPQNNKKHLKLRNILNLIFMTGAVAGILTHLYVSKEIGFIIILVAIAVKMAECTLRIIYR